MGEKALWPTVAVVGIVCLMLSVLLLGGVEPVAIIAVVSTMSGLISLMLYGKLMKIETQTNGMQSSQQALVATVVRDLTEHAKNSVPVEQTEVR